MFINYLKIALRNLWKNKTYSLVNIAGLAMAFAVGLLLFLTSSWQLSFDSFHENGPDLFRTYFMANRPEGAEFVNVSPLPLQPALKEELGAQVQYAVRWGGLGVTVEFGDKKLENQNIRYTDPDFFRMFSFPLVKGHPDKVFVDLNNVVLSQKMAGKLFGAVDPIGKLVRVKNGSNWETFTVSGVLSDFPENSSLQYDLLVRTERIPRYVDSKDSWGSWSLETFVQLRGGSAAAVFEKAVKPFVAKHFKDNLDNLKRDGAKPDDRGDVFALRLLPMKDIHFDERLGGDISRGYIYALLFIAGLIVLIACINFINLSIGRSFTRAREVGLRKVLGALRGQLLLQFWGEAFILSFMALVLGIALAQLMLPRYNALFNLSLSLNALISLRYLVILAVSFVAVTFLAGGYPAWVVSRFPAVEVLKGQLSLRNNRVRSALIVVQFAIATFLIICTLVAYRQTQYLRDKPLGYNKEQVISVPIGFEVSGEQVLERMRQQLSGKPEIISVAAAANNLGSGLDGSTFTSIIGFEHKGKEVRTNLLRVSQDYLKTLEITLLQGRDFSAEFPSDTANAVIINEAMARQFGEKHLVGTWMDFGDSTLFQIVGMVKDYHFSSLHDPIGPITLLMDPEASPYFYLYVRVKPNNLTSGMETVKKAWKTAVPQITFQGSFLNENVDRQYRTERILSQLFLSAAILTVLLSCMGLFAIAVLVTAQRTREIGVRKVLGASTGSIAALLSKDFLRLVLVAFILAAPLGWWGMTTWLEAFAYRPPFPWWTILAAGVLAVLIAFLTVSVQSIKAALANPVEAIRTE